jgi:predicted outer membrane repeat protein
MADHYHSMYFLVAINHTAAGDCCVVVSCKAGNQGGAVYLGMWSSSAVLYNSSFRANNATYKGGAISSLAIDSSILLNNTEAAGNFAGDVSLANQLLQLAGGRPMLQSEGGAVHVGGSRASLQLLNVSMEDNAAAKVGL